MNAIANALLGLMRPSGEELYYAAFSGNTEDVRRLLAQKAPLEYKDGHHVRHRPYRKSTTHRPAHAGALCGKRRRGEGLRGGAGRPLPLPLPPPLSLARGPSRSLSRPAPLSLSHKCVHALAAADELYGAP